MVEKYKLLTPVKAIRKSAIVAEKIKSMIMSNQLKPGDKLPSENELVALLRVSRATIREAFHALELMGLIEVRPGYGASVKNTNIFNVLGFSDSSLTILLASESFTLIEILEVRKILETSIVDLAVQNRSPEDLAVMEKILSNMANSLHDEAGFKSADMKFHCELARLTKNRFLEVLANSMYQIFWERFPNDYRIYTADHERTSQILNLHRTLLTAITNKDEKKAKTLMSEHYNFASDIAKQYLNGERQER